MNVRAKRILREELLRSIAWGGVGYVAWATAVSELPQLPTEPLVPGVVTVFVLPALVWTTVLVGVVGYRLRSGAELQLRGRAARLLAVVDAAVVNPLLAWYLVAYEGWPPVPTLGAVVLTGAFLAVLWYTRVPPFES